jgi:hypothetical protein
MKSLWGLLCLFAYRRWAIAEGRKPLGVPLHRDPLSPCPAYAPRPWKLGDWNDCETDGHHLCKRCAHRMPEEARDV